MSSARSTVPDNENGYKQENRVAPSSNEAVFVPKLPKKRSDGIVVGGWLEGAQDHESIPQPSGSADWTNRNAQERKKIKNEPPSSYSSYPANTRGGTNPDPVVAAYSSARAEGPSASQPRSYAQNDAASSTVDEQRGTSERPQARGYPTHRNSEEKEDRATSSVSRPMYGGQASSTAPTQSSTQAPTPRTLPSNTPTHNVDATPRDGAAVYTGTPQRAPQRTTAFDHASTSGGGGWDRENAYASTINATRMNELGTQAAYTTGTGLSRRDASSQNQTAPTSTSVVSGAPPLPPLASRPNRRDEQKLNAPSALPLSSSVESRDQLGSGSIVTTTPTPFGKPSSLQLPQTRTYQNPSLSASNSQQLEEHVTQERPSGNSQSGVGPPFARGHNLNAPAIPISQLGRSDEKKPNVPPPSSYPTPPRTSLYPTLAAITGGKSGSKQAKSKGHDSQATVPASQSNETRGQGVDRGGNSANTSVVVDVPSSNAERSEAAQKRKGKSFEQVDGRRILESFMANYPSLNVTSELEVHPSFVTGGLVDVHSGVCRKRKVFVKVLRSYEGWRVDPPAGASSKPHITTEMPKWAALKHQNVCEFFGYSTSFGPYPALVYSWCGGDTVFEYLRGRHLRVEKRIRLAQDVAEGLQHLHENDIVHGDLTLKNVLVDDSGVARLCDFGLTQLAEWQQPIEPTVASNYSGRDRYRAPELSNGPASVATFESDVYSLGCILLKVVEELNPFDGVPDVAKQKRKTPPAPPARRKDKTDVLLGMAAFFWNQLEACWEEPATRPKTYKIVENLQTLASNFPLTQLEQVESPPPYPPRAPEPVDKTTLNYGASGSIPVQPPVDVAFSLGSARGLLMGQRPSTRRNEGSTGLSSFSQPSDASVYTPGSKGAGYQPSDASLPTLGSRAGYEATERQFDAAGGSMMTRDEPSGSRGAVMTKGESSRSHGAMVTRDEPSGLRQPTVAHRPSFAMDHPHFETASGSMVTGDEPSGSRQPTVAPRPNPALAKLPPPGKPSSTTMAWGGSRSNSGGWGGGNTATTGVRDKDIDLERGGGGGGHPATTGGVRDKDIGQDDADSGSCCCVLC